MRRLALVPRAAGPRWVVAGLTTVAASGVAVGVPAVAPAATGGQTVTTTVHLAALPVDNLCNGDVVNLTGDLRIRVTTTPRPNGGYTVQSTTRGDNLTGERIFPLPSIGYRGSDDESSFAYYAPPPYPSTYRVVHSTTLIPQANAPRMYLVTVLRETIAADGTPVVPAVERVYLACQQPKCSAQRED
jgi:hypothetical protein